MEARDRATLAEWSAWLLRFGRGAPMAHPCRGSRASVLRIRRSGVPLRKTSVRNSRHCTPPLLCFDKRLPRLMSKHKTSRRGFKDGGIKRIAAGQPERGSTAPRASGRSDSTHATRRRHPRNADRVRRTALRHRSRGLRCAARASARIDSATRRSLNWRVFCDNSPDEEPKQPSYRSAAVSA
jgi:hypothetical protein